MITARPSPILTPAELGSVGKALPSIELEIRDEDGQAVSAGTPGKSTCADLRFPVSTTVKRADSEGWFPTRDAGYLDEGAIFPLWTGDDVIVRGGENISRKSRACYWTRTMSWTRLPWAWHPRSGEKRLR